MMCLIDSNLIAGWEQRRLGPPVARPALYEAYVMFVDLQEEARMRAHICSRKMASRRGPCRAPHHRAIPDIRLA